MSIAIKVQGTQFKVQNADFSAYVELGCVIDGFNGPGGSKPEIDVTTLCSEGQEFIDGLPDFGSIAFTGLYNQQSAPARRLLDLYKNTTGQSVVSWQIVFNDATPGTLWEFEGYVSELSVNMQKNDVVRLSGSVKLSGTITETLGGSGCTPQVITFGEAPTVVEGDTGTVSATSDGGSNPISFTSLTPTVCTVSGTTVTGVTVGSCTIAANQLGGGAYCDAAQVVQTFPIEADGT